MNCPECKEGTLEEDNFDENIIECDTCGKSFIILQVPKEAKAISKTRRVKRK